MAKWLSNGLFAALPAAAATAAAAASPRATGSQVAGVALAATWASWATWAARNDDATLGQGVIVAACVAVAAHVAASAGEHAANRYRVALLEAAAAAQLGEYPSDANDLDS